MTSSTKSLFASMTEELDVKTPYGCYMLSALMFVRIVTAIEEGSTNSTGETIIRLEKSTAIFFDL